MTNNPAASVDLVTGATGMLGSHVAEHLVGAGRRVRAVVRERSDTRFLQSLGVELVWGDLTDADACARAVRGVDRVYHCAAKVGDWGPWREFQTGCIDATRNLGEAAARVGVGRFLHISSTSAYGHPPDGSPPIDETAPMGRHVWVQDPYTRSKVEAEKVLWSLAESSGLPLTVIRPSWLYGERDRTTTARVLERLRRGRVPMIGRGDNPLSAVYVGIVAEAAILAASDAGSVGEAYNITSQGPITQREFFSLFARAAGAPPIRRKVPYRAAYATGYLLESIGRLLGREKPPMVTRYAAWLMGRKISYSTEKARTRLGWRPSLTYEESIGRTVRWFDEAEAENGRPGPHAVGGVIPASL